MKNARYFHNLQNFIKMILLSVQSLLVTKISTVKYFFTSRLTKIFRKNVSPLPLECCCHTLNVHNDNNVRGEISFPPEEARKKTAFSQRFQLGILLIAEFFPPKLRQGRHQGETPRLKSATYERFLPRKCCVNLGG